MIVLLLAACTFAPGRGFGTLPDPTLHVALEPGPARDLGDHTLLTNLGWEVQVDAAGLELGAVELQELVGGAGGSFDPADPPEGYSLCHGGHCHADDGSLVSYAEVEAQLAGGSASFVAVSSWALDAEVDLLAGLDVALSSVSTVPASDISQVAITAGRLHLEGTARTDGTAIPVRVDLDLAPGFTGGLDLPFERGEDPVVDLALALVVDGTLFDDLDFATAAADGEVALDDPSDPSGALLLARLAAVEPVSTIERSPWSEP